MSTGVTQESALGGTQAATLRGTGFALLWVNAFTFLLIASADRFTFEWLVSTTLSGPEWSSGVVLLLLGLPVFVAALPAGVLADRFDRGRILMVTQICGAAISAVIAIIIWLGLMTVPIALILAPIFGSVVAFAQPVRSSVVPSLVPRVLLMRAIVIMTIGANVGMIIGPVLAGVLIDSTGIAAAFAVQSLFFAAGALVLIPLRIPPLAARAAASMRADMAEGISYVWRDRQLRALFVLLAVGGGVMTGGSFVLIPRMARNEFERSAGQASVLFALLGAGLLTTSWLLMWKRRLPRRGLVFMLSMVVGTANMMLQGFAPTYFAFAVMLFLWGGSGGLYINLNVALIQEHAPADKMGRVMSLHSMISMGLAPMGALVAGLLAASIGDRATLHLLGAVGLVSVLIALVVARALRAMD